MYAISHGYIVTANDDGTISLNAKIVAKIESGSESLAADLVTRGFPTRALTSRHAFQAIQLKANGDEALLDTFIVTKQRDAGTAYNMAEALCERARQLPHHPQAFVREVNAPLTFEPGHRWPGRSFDHGQSKPRSPLRVLHARMPTGKEVVLK